MVNVLRATDVPVRHSYYTKYIEHTLVKNTNQDGGAQDAVKKLYFEKQVEPYIEVRLVDPDTGTE